MKDETYNGWTNRETWAVNLWVENDGYLYESRNAMLDSLNEDANAGDAAKVWFENTLSRLKHTNGNFYATLLEEVGSVWRVDWDSLGTMWIDEHEL